MTEDKLFFNKVDDNHYDLKHLGNCNKLTDEEKKYLFLKYKNIFKSESIYILEIENDYLDYHIIHTKEKTNYIIPYLFLYYRIIVYTYCYNCNKCLESSPFNNRNMIKYKGYTGKHYKSKTHKNIIKKEIYKLTDKYLIPDLNNIVIGYL